MNDRQPYAESGFGLAETVVAAAFTGMEILAVAGFVMVVGSGLRIAGQTTDTAAAAHQTIASMIGSGHPVDTPQEAAESEVSGPGSEGSRVKVRTTISNVTPLLQRLDVRVTSADSGAVVEYLTMVGFHRPVPVLP